MSMELWEKEHTLRSQEMQKTAGILMYDYFQFITSY